MKDKVKQLKRQVKYINGVKVNHPHSAANIWYSLFTLFLVAIPVGMLFIPLIIMPGDLKVTGLEIAKFLFCGCKIEKDGLNGLYVFAQYAKALGGNFEMVFNYVLIGQAALWGLFVLLGLIAFIVFIVNLTKGYLNKPKRPKSIAGAMFGFGLLYSLSFVVYYLLEMIQTQSSQLFVWYSFIVPGAALVFLIILGCIYSSNFSECVKEKDLIYKEDNNGHGSARTSTCSPSSSYTEVHKVKKVKVAQLSVLPSNLTSIGGHAYSQNQSLKVANIPLGIPSLGTGAFSNCLNLKAVSIPKSVKSIGANCFFNCTSLERINYAGTKADWKNVKRGSNWLTRAKTTRVVCIDGVVIVNPYK